jgi:hypothetical protein
LILKNLRKLVPKKSYLPLGNNRGNKYSKSSEFLHTKDSEKSKFWDFSFEEMGIFDLPAIYAYILLQNSSKIIFFGHSQGTAQMLAGLSDGRTAIFLGEGTLKFFASAPVSSMGNIESVRFRYLAGLIDSKKFPWYSASLALLQKFSPLKFTQNPFGIYEILPGQCETQTDSQKVDFVTSFCGNNRFFKWICENFVPGVPFDSELENILDD